MRFNEPACNNRKTNNQKPCKNGKKVSATILQPTSFFIALMIVLALPGFKAASQARTGSANAVEYTIDNTQPTNGVNFNTFTEAFNTVQSISTPVVFNVAPGSGPYNEQLVINPLGGASATNTITINGNGATITKAFNVTNQDVIRLNGADHIIIDNLVVSTANGFFGNGFRLLNNADSNVISNCTISLSISTSNSDATGIGVYGSTGNTVMGNNITGGNFGANISSIKNRLINNSIKDFYQYGVYLTSISGALIYGNDISRPARTNPADFNGIYFSGSSANDTISNNRIHDPFGANTSGTGNTNAISLINTSTPSGQENLVYNNLLYNLNSSGAVNGIYSSGSGNAFFYHNTISLNSAAVVSSAMRAGIYCISNLAGLRFKNNLITISKGGSGIKYAIYMGTGTFNTGFIASNNNYYIDSITGTNYVGFYNNQKDSLLSAWQSATGQDANSLSVKPQYENTSTGNFKPSSPALENKGTPVGISEDINGVSRNSIPDIGAFEFDVAPCTAPPVAGISIATSSPALCSTPAPESSFWISLGLSGNSTGAGQTYQWQSSYNPNGPFTPAGNVQPSPDTTFTYNSSDNGKYYRSAVTCNGTTAYSELVRLSSKVFAGGVYTINPSEPASSNNFRNFNDAAKAMRCGITGAVVFNVAPGTYNEQFDISTVSGVSATNRISFQPANGNRSSVNITFNTNTTGNNYLIKIGGFTTIRSLTLTAIAPSDNQSGSGIVITNGNADSVIDCSISVSGSFLTSGAGRTGIDASAKNTVITNNTINNFNFGINVTGNRVLIKQNTIYSTVTSVSLGGSNFMIYDNTIAAGAEVTSSSGISISSCDSLLEIINNRISSSASFGGFKSTRTVNISGCTSLLQTRIINNYITAGLSSSDPSTSVTAVAISCGNNTVLANNVILTTYVGTSTLPTGLSINSNNLQAYNNTIATRLDLGSGNINNTNVVTALFGGTNITLKNNIISQLDGLGVALSFNNAASVTSDYNDLYTNSGGVLVKTTNPAGSYSNLQAWRNASGMDLNSLSQLPPFISRTDLRPDSANANSWALNGQGIHIAGNDKDINGKLRPTTPAQGVPDFGAYELTPIVAPPLATAIPATPAAGTTQSFLFATDTIAKISWAAGSVVPSAIEVRRYSGTLPPALPAGNPQMYFYDSIKATGPEGYDYSIDVFYKKPWLGTIANEADLKLGKGSAAGNWITYNNSTVNTTTNIISAPGLNSFSLFTGLSNAAAVTFGGKVFLQGAYDNSTGLMTNTLNASGILQAQATTQPYNVDAFGYAGPENVGSDFYISHPDIVDWVLIELRSSSSPSTVIARRAAFVKQDGTLVDIDGSSTQITFAEVAPTSYYVVVRHRNHLALRSAAAIDFGGGAGTYDFTNAAEKSYQNQSYPSAVQLGSIWAMRGGNANADNSIKYNGPGNDQNQILNLKLGGSLSTVLSNQYAAEDINMDGQVKANGPGNDPNVLLNIILGGLLSAIFNEQL